MISELNRLKQHMHYVDFDSKNKNTVMRFSIYVVLGLIALAISWLVILAARGYDVDPTTGKVVRNGLVLLWSQPESVDVYVNNVLEDNTPARLPLPVGNYDIKMSKAGYRDWNKKIHLNGSEVIKLNYPRLFPNEIKPTAIAALPSFSDWLQSPDQETMAVHTTPASTEISLYSNVNTQTPPVVIKIPESQLTKVDGKLGTIKISQWSADSDFLIIEHVNGTIDEFIRINVIDTEFININTALNLPLKNVQLDRSENNIMYGIVSGQLRRVNVATIEASPPLIAEVVDYRVSSDGRVAAIQKREKFSSILIMDEADQVKSILDQPATPINQIELGSFEDQEYAVVALSPDEAKLVWFDDSEKRKDNLIATIPGKNIVVYPASFTSRFAVVSYGDNIVVHDFEKFRVFSFDFANLNPESLSWFDDGHIVGVNKKGSIDVVEFDGKNKTNIGSGAVTKVYTDKDFNNFFSLAAAKDGKFTVNSSNLRPL